MIALSRRVAWLVVAAVLLGAEARSAQQGILVLCRAGGCEFHRVSSVLISGRGSVRALPSGTTSVDASRIGHFEEIKFDRILGLYRASPSGIFYLVDPNGGVGQPVVPSKMLSRSVGTPAAAWQDQTIEFVGVPTAKTRGSSAAGDLAYWIVSSDVDRSVGQLLDGLLDPANADDRHLSLIQGALDFAPLPATKAQWTAKVLARIEADLRMFESQEGDPAQLAASLRHAMDLRAIYVHAGTPSPQQDDVLARVATADRLFRNRRATAAALRTAGFPDEYLIKIGQLGLAKWSIPDVLQDTRKALQQSTMAHQERSRQYMSEGHWNRAFDEAELAANNSCDAGATDAFYRARVLLVDHSEIEASSAYAGPNKALLDQIVRELDHLDPSKAQLTLDRIHQGEMLDPTFLALQWKKAEFLDLLGKYREALAVIERIERNVRLDHDQVEQCLRLDGRITTNLLDATQKAEDEARRQFEVQRFQQALDAAAKGLTADPGNTVLLYYSALSAAFLKQKATAIAFVRTYLNEWRTACTGADEPAKILQLYRELLGSAASQDVAGGIPHWISGIRYRPTDVSYDPVSLGFLQPVNRVTASAGEFSLTTLFQREDRSFLVKSISTTQNRRENPTAVSATELFAAEPKYDRTTLTMLEIGSRASSSGARTSYALTYANSPSIDPALVQRFTGKQITRGWAGNPFFHPFIWNGLYVFDFTYDALGRVALATPIPEEAGARTDRFSEPLEFSWAGDSKRLLSIRGLRSGYRRELKYDRDGLLRSEAISFPKGGHGTIEYDYLPDSQQLRSAVSNDNFFDRRERLVMFDWRSDLR